MSPIPAINDLYALLPFILLTISSLMFLIFQFIFHSKDRWFLRFLTLIMLAVVAVLVFRSSNNPGYGKYFNGQLKISELTIWLNLLYLSTAFITVVVSPIILKNHDVNFPEFYPLILFASLGMMFMTSGSDLIVIFIGLEILSLSLYILVGLARNTATALEATMKYFLLGSFSSGFMLMGIAFLFGGCGSTDLEAALRPIASSGYLANYTMLGLSLFLVGIFFKMALFPFHAWTPDVYEGALTTITGFMASGAKVASMSLLLIVFLQIPFGDKTSFWNLGIGIIAMLSMTFGNIAALRQTHLKRILAYSSISHAGYVTAGILVGGNVEVLYYLYMYAFMNLAGFTIIAYLENTQLIITLESISGMLTKKPWTAVGLSVVFLSLAGFPPFSGFWAKLFLFQKIAESEQTFNIILLITAVLNSAIGFFYYVKIVLYTFMRKEEGHVSTFKNIDTNLSLTIASILLVVFVGFSWLIFHPSSFL
jgi:NADH-quinone oxidoreductase subunit N